MRTSEAYYTPEEYITLERKAIPDAEIVRSEYINGKINVNSLIPKHIPYHVGVAS